MLTNTPMQSYDQNGKKLSFANWISNLSPQEVPFTSMTGKESINQTMFQWQTDSLSPVAVNAKIEGAVAVADGLNNTEVLSNVTQILNKVVKVSDTANATANYGRGRELQYQMEKAGKEIKRDLEFAFLNQVEGGTAKNLGLAAAGASNGFNLGNTAHGKAGGPMQESTSAAGSFPVAGNVGNTELAGDARMTAGFRGLVAAKDAADPDTGAIVHKATPASTTDSLTDALTEAELFDMTYNLYLSGSEANIIMFHPMHAKFFSGLQEVQGGQRARIFENTPKFSVYVSTVVDPLGREYKLIPNRWMPQDAIYFFAAKDWTQMVLRAPQRTKLAKDGSYEKWMIEMEVGLRHRHPYASGVLELTPKA